MRRTVSVTDWPDVGSKNEMGRGNTEGPVRHMQCVPAINSSRDYRMRWAFTSVSYEFASRISEARAASLSLSPSLVPDVKVSVFSSRLSKSSGVLPRSSSLFRSHIDGFDGIVRRWTPVRKRTRSLKWTRNRRSRMSLSFFNRDHHARGTTGLFCWSRSCQYGP